VQSAVVPFLLASLIGVVGCAAPTATPPLVESSPPAPAAAQSRTDADPCRLDASGHQVRYVTVEPGVTLEVLDWGGTGLTMVLLAGLGDSAHVFDAFAHHFTDRFRVIGITRRGFGRSSQPALGYDLDTRARDDLAVLDALGIREAIFVGHSVAGTEMNKIAAEHPERVKVLVYLDALDLGSGGWAALRQPPGTPADADDDLESVQAVADASARWSGYRAPLAAICHLVRRTPSGRVVGPVTPPEIPKKILEGLQPAAYDRIQAPALGIFNAMTPRYRLPYYRELAPADQAKFDQVIVPLAEWNAAAIRRFKTSVKGARVVELEDANHYVYIVNEGLVAEEMRRFLAGV
jgi:non-heme chloroperoxidase